MRIEYTGRQTDVPPEIRGLVERKLKKLSKAAWSGCASSRRAILPPANVKVSFSFWS